MADTFKLGDVVALKSGGVPMTVADLPWLSQGANPIRAHGDIYIVPVAWDVEGTIMRDGFPEAALELTKRVVATYELSPEDVIASRGYGHWPVTEVVINSDVTRG
jgi:hypothetical protein